LTQKCDEEEQKKKDLRHVSKCFRAVASNNSDMSWQINKEANLCYIVILLSMYL